MLSRPASIGLRSSVLEVLNRRDPDVRIGGTQIYVGRPSPWGNPFPATGKRSRHEAVELFREYAESRVQVDRDWLSPLREATALICWCAPLECHADVLAELI